MSIADVENLLKDYLSDVEPVLQATSFPVCMLDCVGNNVSETKTKFNFIMSKADFETLLLPLFLIKSENSYSETFYDMDNHLLMENNYWLKEITSHDHEPQISIKKTTQQDQTLNDRVKKCLLDNMCNNLHLLIQNKKYTYHINVTRTRYQLKTNRRVILTKDVAHYDDFSSIVVLSICGPTCNDNKAVNDMRKNLVELAKPCQSKIVELIQRKDPSLYQELVKRNHVTNIGYESMCVATFEVGKEKAEEYKKLADEVKQQQTKDGIDPLLIDYDYSNNCMYGIVEYSNDEY